MNGRSKRYLRATSRLRPLGPGRKSDVQISNGDPGDGLCYLGADEHSPKLLPKPKFLRKSHESTRLSRLQLKDCVIASPPRS